MKKLIILILLLSIITCKKETPTPLSWQNTTITNNTIQDTTTSTFVGLHKHIFATKCALYGCHDGNFEPDFRTVESSYSTLVWHNITKNNLANSFKFRVYPFDTTKSVLYERITNCCFVNINDRMPNDNIGSKLPQSDIDAIGKWIMAGAIDINGNLPTAPDYLPVIQDGKATDAANIDIDFLGNTNRPPTFTMESLAQFPNNKDIKWIFYVGDDWTALENLSNATLKFSFSSNDFSNPFFSIPLQYSSWQVSNTTANGYSTTFNTNSLATIAGSAPIYFQFSINDNTHVQNAKFPVAPQQTVRYYGFTIMP